MPFSFERGFFYFSKSKNIFTYEETFLGGGHTLNITTKKGVNEMDPISFGIVFTGATGGTLLVLSLMGKKFHINEDMVKLVLEILKYGSILYLLKYIYFLFI